MSKRPRGKNRRGKNGLENIVGEIAEGLGNNGWDKFGGRWEVVEDPAPIFLASPNLYEMSFFIFH